MKLYEFTYTDNQNLSESDVLRRVEEFLRAESEVQGWAPDYKFQQCKPIEQTPNNEKNYFFEVNGKYLTSDSLSFDEDMAVAGSSSGPPIAAREREANP